MTRRNRCAAYCNQHAPFSLQLYDRRTADGAEPTEQIAMNRPPPAPVARLGEGTFRSSTPKLPQITTPDAHAAAEHTKSWDELDQATSWASTYLYQNPIAGGEGCPTLDFVRSAAGRARKWSELRWLHSVIYSTHKSRVVSVETKLWGVRRLQRAPRLRFVRVGVNRGL